MVNSMISAFRSASTDSNNNTHISVENVSTFIQNLMETSSQIEKKQSKPYHKRSDNEEDEDKQSQIDKQDHYDQDGIISQSGTSNLLLGSGHCAGFAGVLDELIAKLLTSATYCKSFFFFFQIYLYTLRTCVFCSLFNFFFLFLFSL